MPVSLFGKSGAAALVAVASLLLSCAEAADVRAADAAKAAESSKPLPSSALDTGNNAKPQPGAAAVGAGQPASTKVVDDAKPGAEAAKKPADKWSDSEIADAKARCTAIFHRFHAVAIPHDPIKDGACGAPAPVELISVGQNPEVVLSPPAIVRCDLAEPLAQWMEKDIQPLARKYLKSEIIKIETMSSYECRNAYGRKTTRLSEHGLANAIDIAGFVTASAKTAYVLQDWGTPEREILAKIAEEKAAAEKKGADDAKASAANSSQPTEAAAPPKAPGAKPVPMTRPPIFDGLPKLATAHNPDAEKNMVAGLSAPDKLGGPTRPNLTRQNASAVQTAADKTLIALHTPSISGARDAQVQAFLHDAHAAACRIFGTTLGPEANADHRNHFHVDMAPRTATKICD